MERKYNGFRGKILRVDLSIQKVSVEDVDPRLFRIYFGGGALAMHYLLKEIPKGTDAFDPENRLVFMTSPLTGAKISGQGRHTAAALSPLTGGLADSQCGGWWGAELKFAGYDGIIIHGKSEHLVNILIQDDKIKILEAEPLRGKTTGEVQTFLKEAFSDVRILQAGPAGENLVRYACISADLKNFHGRGGLGAVMGSKNLRAIMVQGSNREINIANPQGLNEIRNWFNKNLKTHPAISVHHELGTSKGIVPVSVSGLLPTYNFQDGSFKYAEDISGETMKKVLNGKTETCYACGVACKRSVEGEKGKFKVTRQYGGPEYESIGLLGSNLGVNDITAVAALNERCNALGLDTISAGATISWAVECFERELLTKEDTQGVKLEWNDPEVYIKLLDDISYKNGLGELLSQGCSRASKAIGRGTEKYAIHVKGQEPPNHEPRGKWGVALGYAISNTGADHLQSAHDGWFTQPGDFSEECNWVDLEDLSPVGIIDPVPAEDISGAKVRLFVYLQQIWGFHDVLDWCIFTAVPEFRALSLYQLTDIVKHVTGWRTSLFELMKSGERWATLGRAFNYKHGLTSKEDTLPDRFFEPLREGTLKGHYVDKEKLEEGIKMYYEMMGWNEQGKPTRGKLEELNIGWAWEEIKEL